jgi:hypothetical protein
MTRIRPILSSKIKLKRALFIVNSAKNGEFKDSYKEDVTYLQTEAEAAL